MNGTRHAWNAGEMVTIDESMIRYNERTGDFVQLQYMPRKPIKHGIKVFAICCSITVVLLGFEVYVGKETIVERLINESGLSLARGRTLFMDNWYTSVGLAKLLFEKYGWRLCGTVVPTDKVARKDEDVPFHKLLKGALSTVPRGWFREAVLPCLLARKDYYVQATTWKDRKQVMFIHTVAVGSSIGKHTVRRSKRGNSGREVFPALCGGRSE
jgi:hypothetical protein